jgi:hypothetical protein
MPAFLVFGGVINFTVTSPPQLELPALRNVPLRSNIFANYGVDSPNLIFPQVDPDIILDINKDATASAAAQPADSQPTLVAGPTGTPSPGLPLPTIGITLPPLVTTDLPGVVNTVVGPVVNTVVAPVINTVVAPIINTVVAPVINTVIAPVNTIAAPVNTVVAPVATAVAPITNPVQTLVAPLPCVPIPFIKTCP